MIYFSEKKSLLILQMSLLANVNIYYILNKEDNFIIG